MTEQRPSKDLTSWGDAKLAPEEFHFGGVRYVRGDLVDRLRTALTGISSCSTCEVCRGAATLALGERITEEIHAAVDERLDRVERELAQPPDDIRFALGLMGVETKPAPPPGDSWDANGSPVGGQ